MREVATTIFKVTFTYETEVWAEDEEQAEEVAREFFGQGLFDGDITESDFDVTVEYEGEAE